MAQEFYEAFCDADLDPYKSDKVIKDRLDLYKQQLQHQTNKKNKSEAKGYCL